VLLVENPSTRGFTTLSTQPPGLTGKLERAQCEHDAVSSKPQDAVADVSVLPLTRPQLAEARRMRAAELFEQRRPSSEVARAVGMHPESVRRWKRLWEQGGAEALRRRPATGRPPKLDDAQVEAVRTALEQGAQAHGFEADLWTLERSAWWSSG
ncbi:helix-turn-helix domain-containing protein, partial [Streptomyces sp. NPDC052415]|uniref:helix-turn-helix domain-containing protein n=1 Tax=Streptomyces sp. NPDC052415 TaxID=3365690 RepID=UPI0037D0274F